MLSPILCSNTLTPQIKCPCLHPFLLDPSVLSLTKILATILNWPRSVLTVTMSCAYISMPHLVENVFSYIYGHMHVQNVMSRRLMDHQHWCSKNTIRELMWLPLLGNEQRCRLIAILIRDSLLIQTQLYRSLYRGNPLGSCFLFRKGSVTGLSVRSLRRT